MGQTLTHGVYLPDEGERNCYSGLAANWQILDTSVGTIAEHTSALSGKAPLVHTHTKSDITDLLNSDFIPSANNAYDLGSASYQWKSVYAQSYYYNGVAWGLDKENVWTKTQNFVGENQGTEFSVNYRTCFAMYGRFDTVGESGMFFTKFRPYKAQGSLASSDVIQYGVDVLENEVRTNNVFDLQASGYDSNTGKFTKIDVVSGLSDANLGTSTNKWKTLNGCNPGALSLPDYLNAITIDTTSWSVPGNNSYTPTQDGWLCVITKDTATSSIFVFSANLSGASQHCGSVYGNGSQGQGRLSIMFPVRANLQYIVILRGDSASDIFAVRFYPCLGNV